MCGWVAYAHSLDFFKPRGQGGRVAVSVSANPTHCLAGKGRFPRIGSLLTNRKRSVVKRGFRPENLRLSPDNNSLLHHLTPFYRFTEQKSAWKRE